MATILVIDDEPTNRRLLSTILGYRGHRIVEAADGQEGLDKSRIDHPDLAVVDILMPTMDGFEFVRQLRSDPAIAKTPVIFYSAAYHENEIRSLARDCGVARILTKPADPEVIIDTVDSALGHAGPPPEALPEEEFEREHLRLMTDKLSQKVAELETVSLRLGRLIEIGGELALQHDSDQLIQGVCVSARDVIGAGHADVGITDEEGRKLLQYKFHGMSPEKVAALTAPAVDKGAIHALLTKRRAIRLRNSDGHPEDLGLPADHAPLYSFLGVPILSAARLYGWLTLRNKIGRDGFSPEDERLAVSLAAQTAVTYENIQRYKEIHDHAANLEQQVNERTADLQRSNAELEQFAYVASHDLQEPLRKILGFTDLLAEHLKGRLDDTAKEYMLYVRDAAGRMRELIQDLLAYSRAGKQTRKSERVDSLAVLSRVLADLQPAIDETAAVITNSGLPSVWADGIEIGQLFQNLISNAIKYRSNQPPRIHIGAKLVSREAYLVQRETNAVNREAYLVKREIRDTPSEIRDTNNEIRDTNNEIRDTPNEIRNTPETVWLFSVRDNGIGVESKYAERIFRVFQRLHARAQYPGTGIGLAICKKIVERHGGSIWVESAKGQGAVFFFTLPTSINNSLAEDRGQEDKI
jgi:signal transduction histidine kinase/DNA-binding response OmpR family regulator